MVIDIKMEGVVDIAREISIDRVANTNESSNE
jgi:hypothetical protein